MGWRNPETCPACQPPPFLSPERGPTVWPSMYVETTTFGKAPRIQNWSINLQREVAKFLVEVDYAEIRGRYLNSSVDLNQVNPSYLSLGSLLQQQITSPAVVAAGFTKPYANFPNTGTLAQALRPFPQFLNVWSRNSGQGQTWYDAASFKVHRRFGAWQFSASYVRSKSLGLMTYRAKSSTSGLVPSHAWDMYNLPKGKVVPAGRPAGRFDFLNTYDLPFGSDEHFFGP